VKLAALLARVVGEGSVFTATLAVTVEAALWRSAPEHDKMAGFPPKLKTGLPHGRRTHQPHWQPAG
jgi:hypothetical protein